MSAFLVLGWHFYTHDNHCVYSLVIIILITKNSMKLDFALARQPPYLNKSFDSENVQVRIQTYVSPFSNVHQKITMTLQFII